jgi:uncharacterized protein YbjT (DUF2867 family)
MSNTKKLIAVVGATGHQGGAVVRALQASGQFKVRALTRNPAKHPQLADEVVLADLERPETLKAAFAGAHGVFLVTNFREPGTDERKQALAALHAAAEMLAYFEAHTYLGADSRDAITLANRVAGRQPTKFAAWARASFAVPAPTSRERKQRALGSD